MSELFEVEHSNRPMSDDDSDAILAEPGFGRYFTDHMASVKWTADLGWHDAKVEPYAPLAIDPATNFVHYGQAIFEGAGRSTDTTTARW